MIDRKTLATLAAGLVIGSLGATAWSAATPPPPKGYVVAEVNVKDLAAYRAYGDAAFPIIRKYGGTFLTRGGQTVAVEGAPPAQRVMIIEFASLEQAKRFEYSKDYTDIAPLRQKSADSRLFLVEGTNNAAASKP
ncbi:DUF1330 domain-containing protein [Sphingobium nicotianae]|uniref:DUF1330 domain-containing protein n=1 Tax=Sphingobium nicotianae TaxID=2782607 RepID=A0A9X1DCM6_9SPHN|nr:DUF1330 domain-containing protein [Sphingobium nicotianae]MBT2187690.1 DUF1330 domain-containing protein [Sphingobium nicotianae]